MAAANSITEHDVVVLQNPLGKWPSGTIGAVVSDYGDIKLVEITNGHGVALDYVQVPASQLKRWTGQETGKEPAFATGRGAWSDEEADQFSAELNDAWSTWTSEA